MKLTTAEAIAELQKVDTLDMPARLCEAHYMAIDALKQLKQGHWMDRTSGYAFNDECSECGYIVHIQFINEYKYCPNCGARMAESEG